ncbi:transaldolase [Mycobacterium xenopi 3993]|nr:transaldolase [Mycobacterium xenopi 3993]
MQELIDTKCVVGVTSNPTIFQKAIAGSDRYNEQIADLAKRGADVDSAVRTIVTDDVRAACDVLKPQWEASEGWTASLARSCPGLAHDTEKTIAQAGMLWKIVDRPNLFIKIPATKAGLPAITAAIAQGISVNVTLIFSVERHRQVMDAYLAGSRKPRRLAATCRRSIRSHRFSFPGWTPKSTTGWRKSAPKRRSHCGARPVSPTPGWPTPPTRRCSRVARVTRRSSATARGCSARCGPRPVSRTPSTQTLSTSPSWSPRIR